MKRVLAALAALLLGWILAGGSGGGVGASSAELLAVGWWWRAQTGLANVAVPPPPDVPEGGLMVAGAPDGATAVAAVRFELAEGESSPVLTLEVASDQGGEAAVLAACPVGAVWIPAQAGAWDAKPTAGCDLGSAPGQRSPDGKTWTFDLGGVAGDGEVNVLITPGKVADLPDGVNGSTFSLAFNPPTGASLRTVAGGDTSALDSGPSLAPPDTGFSPEVASGGFVAEGPGSSPVAFEPSLPEEDQRLTATAPPVEQATRGNVPVAAVEAPGGEGVAFLAALAAIGAGVWALRQPRPALRLLGPMAGHRPPAAPAADPASGGLGRFTRRRLGSPPPLR